MKYQRSGTAGMDREYQTTSEKKFKNCFLTSYDYGGEQLHLIRSTGPVGRRERAPVFEHILKTNSSGRMFYILDNRGGHEIELTSADMNFLNDMLINGGITYVRGAVITNDEAYSILVSMAHAKAKASDFEIELISTTNHDEAETFVVSKLRDCLAP
jgi:hypothetical protein|tara:strand:+ start:9084 stop:9554 length:471 start_codon:yes stop_codon:yes gene_type:complete